MGQTTAIEWCDSTLNLQAGCDGCELWNPKAGIKHCYAGTLTERYGGKAGWPRVFEEPALFPQRLAPALKWPDLTGKERPEKPWLNGLPRLIFLNDMGDTFTESLPLDWLAPHLPAMAESPHQWLVLTKRPKRMRQFFEQHACPPNLWVGASITDQPTANARVGEILRVRAAVRFLSIEPMLSAIDLHPWVGHWVGTDSIPSVTRIGAREIPSSTPIPILHWIITGGESGPKARPSNPDWFRGIRRQCQQAGIAYFHKQNGEWGRGADAGVTGTEPHQAVMFGDGRPGDYRRVYRVGKKTAGRKLDGQEWSQFPAPQEHPR